MANSYALHLKGLVGGADFDRDYVDYVLSQHKDKPVNVLIDSLGGSVATALSIAAAFRNHADVAVHFVGMNASAATIASLGAKHISMDAHAMYLVHKCSTAFFEWGSLNADQFSSIIADCEKIKADLDKLDLNIASMYSAKCRKETKDLLDLMARGGWLSAQEALEWGFVDEITDCPEEAAPKLTDAVASELAAAGIPIPNIPVEDSQSLFGRFIASLASLFKSSNSVNVMSKDSNQELNDRIAELENSLVESDNTIADLQAQISDLNAQIADLNQKPGDDSQQVIVDSTHSDDRSADPVAQFFNDLEEAKKTLAEIQ